MQRESVFLIVIIIFVVGAVAITGEYFAYKYFLSLEQNNNAGNSSLQNEQKSAEKFITAFDFQNPVATGIIDQENFVITLTVSNETNLKNLIPNIIISNKASVSPNSGVAQDFTNPVVYTVKAEDGSEQKYTAKVNTVVVQKSSEKAITSFRFASLTPRVDGTIDEDNHVISVVVPLGTDITNLAPTIKISYKATLYPAAVVAQNFSKPFTYVVVAEDGSKQYYTINVSAAPQ